MVTAAASERGAGSDPALVAVAGRVTPGPRSGNAWIVATVAGEPPPKITARPPDAAAAASCSAAPSAPIRRVAPVAVRTAYTAFADAPLAISPPRTSSWPGDPATATSRLTGSGRCQGSRPASAAGRPRAAAAARVGSGTLPPVPAPPRGPAATQAATAATSKASTAAAARLRRTRAGTRRSQDRHRRTAKGCRMAGAPITVRLAGTRTSRPEAYPGAASGHPRQIAGRAGRGTVQSRRIPP